MGKVKDYYNLYLKCDILLLADLFEKIRRRCLKNYSMYPGHCLNAPVLRWGSIRSMNKVELQSFS